MAELLDFTSSLGKDQMKNFTVCIIFNRLEENVLPE